MAEPNTRWAGLRGPVLLAHRGHHARWPENSLEAFRAALEAGADALELDVRMTRDGRVVVCHDADGARVAGERKPIAACPLDEVERWRLRGAPGDGHVQVPTLEALLSALPGALLNVDVKQSEPDMVSTVLDVVARFDASDRVLLTSFDATTLRRVRAAGYEGVTGLAQAEAAMAAFLPRVVQRFLPPRGRRLQIPARYGGLNLGTASLIRHAHALGLAVDYWVVNDTDEAAALLAAGADGIVTDALEAMVALFEQSPHTAGWRERRRAAE